MTVLRRAPRSESDSNPDIGRFEQLFDHHYDAVLAYALARSTVELAKDVAAQTFLVAWRRRDELPEEPRGWLLGVARRSLADLRQARDRQSALGARLSQSDASALLVGDVADAVTQRDAVRAALAQLKPADAELLRLIAWDGLTYEEAAQSLGCSTAALAVRLHRARRRFETMFVASESLQPASVRPPRPSTTRPLPSC
jgi:RNA polymerase sigma-70 factor (ECF subfamily)